MSCFNSESNRETDEETINLLTTHSTKEIVLCNAFELAFKLHKSSDQASHIFQTGSWHDAVEALKPSQRKEQEAQKQKIRAHENTTREI